jgi:alkaline phosphatase
MMRDSKWRRRSGWVWAVAALAVLASACAPAAFSETATNIILLIGDGMGFEQIKAAGYFKGTNLSFETWARLAEVQTRSASYPTVTDSAAAGTAMATGHKAYNGVVSLANPGDGREYETVLEYLKRKGKRTGLVTTTFMTDATPAVFGAHDLSRSHYAAIAADYLQRSRPNVLFGGGGYGMSVTGAVAAGYSVVTNRLGMQALDTAAEIRVSGQFGSGNMPYEYEGLGELPHLSEMTETALDVLARSTNGFFLMVEGGRIDHACHANNITNCVREMVEFDNAVEVAVNWVSNRTDTLVIVTADHECGGLTVLADNGLGMEPDVLWSSGGHTATNVGVFARGPGAEMIFGGMDNTDIYRVIMRSQPMIPEAVGIGMALGNGIRTDWNVKPGDTCRLDAVNRLSATNWASLHMTTADTHEVTLMDTNQPPPPARFYRLVVPR